MRPNAWDKYEVALLIDMYQRIKAGAISREAGLAELSNNLRQMAINRGVQIDDVYRNLSGMSWQMAIIDKMFTERYSYGRKPAAVFTEMVALYNDEREQYNILHKPTCVDYNLKTSKGYTNPIVYIIHLFFLSVKIEIASQ